MAAVNRIELQVEYLEKHPEIDILGGWTETIDSAGTIWVIMRSRERIRSTLKRCFCSDGGALETGPL